MDFENDQSYEEIEDDGFAVEDENDFDEDAEYDDDDTDLREALKDYDPEDPDHIDSTDEDNSNDDETEEEQDPESDESSQDQDDSSQDFKNEENARNAERRRQQQQLQQQKLLEELQNSPEFILAQKLQTQFGKTPEQLLQDMQQAELRKQAELQGVPVEFLERVQKAEDRAKESMERLSMYEYQLWERDIEDQKKSLKEELPMLTDEDIAESKDYLLKTLKNVNVPLKRAAYALHGEKIFKGLKDIERNEALAEVSGRKKSAIVPPAGRKDSSNKGTLTSMERAAARALGMSDEEYLKFK